MKVRHGEGSPSGPGSNSGKLSRTLGRGLAEAVVLELDVERDLELEEGISDSTPMENVVVTDRVADVFEGSESSVEVSESSDVARLCTWPV